MRRLLMLSLLALPFAAAHAQADMPFTLSKEQMQEHKAALLKKAASDPHGVGLETVHRDAGHYVLLVGRLRTGEAELHADWADEMVVNEGRVVVVIGGTMDGQYAQPAAGEFRGTGITGGKEYPLQAGEMLYVPAALPHWVKVVGPEPMFMTVYKVK